LKFIIHIVDAPGHGTDYVGGYDKYPREGNKTDEILTYFAKNNFSIAGFETNSNYAGPSFKRAQKIFRDNGNLNYLFKYYSTYEIEEDYLLNSVYDSFQYIQNTAILHGIDISEEQGDIEWNKIKEDKSIDFVIIRAGIGNETDSKFIDNYNGAKDAGIPIGIYWYAKATNKIKAVEKLKLAKMF
jgi:sugar phosphate isomerase/epimerase